MRSQKGKILNWILFAILLVAGLVLLIYFQKIREEIPKKPTPVAEEKKEVEIKKPSKPTKTFATEELSEEEKAERDNEALNKALQSGEGCESIQYDPALKQKCLDILLYNSALKKNDEKLCQQIADADLKEKCLDKVYAVLAAQSLDENLCKKISDSELRQNCLDRIQASFGRTAKTADECQKIEDTILQQQCLDNYYYSASIEKLNKESCETIKDLKLKERCLSTVTKSIEVAQISLQQAVRTYQTDEEKLAGCDELGGENADTCKDDANYNLALSKKDIAFCSEIENSVKKDQCVKVQGANINNFFLRQAVSLKNPSLCDKILDEGLRTSCLTYAQ